MTTRERPLALRDIARMAGTSASTVSRVLSGRGPVSGAMTERVMQVVRETGFTVNGAASALARRRSDASGLVHNTVMIADHDESGIDDASLHAVGHGRSGILAQCNQGILEAADRLGIAVSLCLLSLDDFSASETPAKLQRLPADGLLAHSMRGTDPVALNRAAPTVAYPSRPVFDCCCPVVEADDGAGIRAVVGHLAELGHRRLEFVSPYLSGERVHMPYVERRNAFATIAEARRLRATVADVALDEMGDYARRIRLTAASERPTALVCSSDGQACALGHSLVSNGVRVPQDISVTGFDGIALYPEWGQKVTTWRPDWKEIGAVALATLLAVIRGEAVARRSLVGGELCLGATTAPPPEVGHRMASAT